MSAAVELPGVGHATTCQVAAYHAPKPLRYVWHHIQPEGCGGATAPANLVQVCDSCHYSIHVLLWQLANSALTISRPNHGQLAVARQGLAACQAAGTTGSIPKEA